MKLLSLACPSLDKEEKQKIVKMIFVEMDLISDDLISFVEFDQIIARAPDFQRLFNIRIV